MQVSVRELKTHLSRYLAEVREGRTIEISSHRKIVARLSGVVEARHEGVNRLLAEGTAEWAGGKPQGANIRLTSGDQTVSDMLLEDRG